MDKQTFSVSYDAENPVDLADLSDREVELLRRVIEICAEAKASGNNPFGCLLADAEGTILMEQGNAEHDKHGDATAHAETELMRRASSRWSKDEMATFTMYSCGEPCAMCAGAMYWANLGRLVYIGREEELKRYTGDDPRNPTLALPCRAVFAAGQKDIPVVLGPVPELEPEYMALHEGFWHPSTD
jgi:tRNA(Arg) A34 adenosine deaminase TadA